MAIKEPDREPDYISTWAKYYFDEMIYAIITHTGVHQMHCNGNQLRMQNGNEFTDKIQDAYQDWQIECVLLGDRND